MAGQEAKGGQLREAFSLSRSLEYLSESELTKQIGYEREVWLEVVLKELIDNALDHCEEIGRLPEVVVTLTADSLSVRDNGLGILAEIVAAMRDFENRTSTRAAFRCPTRGAQGNAGKIIVAAPFVLNGNEGLAIVEARGIRHEIAVTIDRLTGKPNVQHRQHEKEVQDGTLVEVKLPCILSAAKVNRFVLFCRNYAALNPHLTLTLELPDTRYDWPRTVEACGKWSAAEREPPGWHDLDSFTTLAACCIAKDRDAGKDRLVRVFLRDYFAGLKRSDALQAVAQESGLMRANLSALLNCEGLDKKKTSALLAAMQKHGKTPKPERLGCVGRKHVSGVFENLGAGEIKYRKVAGEVERRPFVVEAAFAELVTGKRAIITGCNFSPSINRTVVRELDALLEQQMVKDDSTVAFMLHVATVGPTFLDRGKAVLYIDSELEEAIETCVIGVTAEYCKQRKRDERDAAAAARRLDRLSRARPDCTLKEAIFSVLDEAIQKASGGGICEFSDRDLYYAARQLIQQFTDAELSQGYFDKKIDEWEEENTLIPGRMRDPRGFLLEPHTSRRVPLGTKAVDDYEIPAYLYDTILYVEKKGLLSKFQLGQIGERYDCAIIAAEGYAVKAAKALIQAAQQGHKMKVLCFHDADPHGYNIARTLSESTGAHKFEIEIIDAGLNMTEALEMGLASETFTRTKAMPRGLNLNKADLEAFTGIPRKVIKRNGNPGIVYEGCRRVELNALSADPPAFLRWIEKELKKHGVAQKLVPPKKVISARVTSQRENILRQRIQQRLNQVIDMPSLLEEVTRKLLRRVKVDDAAAAVQKWAKKAKPEPWTRCVDEVVTNAVTALEADIGDEVDAVLEERFEE